MEVRSEKYKYKRGCELMDHPKYFHMNIDQIVERVEWEDLIRSINPRIFWTINFNYQRYKSNCGSSREKIMNPCENGSPDVNSNLHTHDIVSDQRAFITINEFIKRINQKKYGRQKDKYLKGVGAFEYQSCGQPHFHLLVENNLSEDELKTKIDVVLGNARKHRDRARDPFACLDGRNMNIQVDLNSGIANYCTKVFEAGKRGKMVILDQEGVF